MASIHPGYLGIAEINGKKIRCNSFGIVPNQEVLFYNHVVGMNDKLPDDGSDTKTEEVGIVQTQRTIWRPSVIKIGGGMSFFAVAGSSSANYTDLFNYAKKGNYFDVDFKYYCDKAKKIKDCRINTFEISATAGDIVTISADVLAKNITESEIGSDNYRDAEKFVTWDKISIDVSGGYTIDKAKIQAFTLHVNNNANGIYTAKPTTEAVTEPKALMPYDLRLGMQEVSGEITVYLDQGEEFIDTDLSTPYTITVTLPSLTITIPAVFNSQNMVGVVGPVITSIPFVGVDKALGE